MKKIIYIFIFLIIVSCSNTKTVYWCGDHPCINKKEREAYFKKNMIVEVKNLKKNLYKKNSDIDKIINQAKINEKKRIKNEKLLAKQAKLEEKRRIKEEKKILKQAKLEKKRKVKDDKKLSKQIIVDENNMKKNKIKEISNKKNNQILSLESSNFKNLVEKIIKRNDSKPYPEINNIPN